MSASQTPPSAEPAAEAGEVSSRAYTVLARRYRPQQFEECLGQEHVRQALVNAIETGRVGHAYLFTGSRGVGKTSMARIFAKALNCARGTSPHPCDQCDICRAIAVGEDVDVLEIDGASNRGIDEVRELRQSVGFRPSRSRFKIYIIDEVHMLSKDAFNALLKTLEEPPPHVKFFFATTEAQKIPITILSRCQRFDFAGIGLGQIVERLGQIVAAEGVDAEPDALELVARRAGGSMRDSQSLLDQLLAFAGKRLTADDVHRVLGTAGEERVRALAQALAAGNAAACLDLVDAAVDAGVQLAEWIEQMLEHLRDLLVLGVHPNANLLSMPNRCRPEMLEQARSLPPERLLEWMDLFAACRGRMRSSGFGRTLVEMTLVRICHLDRFVDLRTGPPAGAWTPPVPAATAIASKKNLPDNPAATPSAPAAAAPAAAVIELSAESVEPFWKSVLAHLDDAVLVTMLGRAVAVRFEPPSVLLVEFAAAGAQSRAHCEQPSRIEKIESAAGRLAGRPVKLRIRESATPSTSPAPSKPSYTEARERAARMPLVRKAEQALDAKILDALVTPPAARPAPESDSERPNP